MDSTVKGVIDRLTHCEAKFSALGTTFQPFANMPFSGLPGSSCSMEALRSLSNFLPGHAGKPLWLLTWYPYIPVIMFFLTIL